MSEVSAVQRQIFDCSLVDHTTEFGRGRLNQFGASGNFDYFRHFAHRKRDVLGDCLANAQSERIGQGFLEILCLNRERVRGGLKIYKSEVTTLIGVRLCLSFGRLIDQLHRCARHGGAVGICHRSIDFADGCLRL